MCACCAPALLVDYEDFASAPQLEAIQQLKALVAAPLDQEKAVELLQRLWLAVHGPQGPAFPGVEHDSWTSLGFQCKRPLSDVRAAKQFGLELLVQVVETEPSLRHLVLASDDEYPFCAAVLDVAFMLFCALKLTPSLPSMCPAIGTKIREPDTADRVDLQGFAGLASTASSPASLMVPLVAMTAEVMQDAWVRLKQTLSEGGSSGEVSEAAAPAAGGGGGDASTAILHFQHTLKAARTALLSGLQAQPSSTSDLRALVVRAGRRESIVETRKDGLTVLPSAEHVSHRA